MNRGFLLLWIGVAVVLTMACWLLTMHRPFALESGAWANAHMALLARSFAQQGTFHLRAVPIQNNLPLGRQPDTYLHWPPLFAILLGVAFRLFGDSATTVHGFVLCVNILYFAAFYRLVEYCFNRWIALVSIFGLLVLPEFVQYGSLAWTVNAAVGAMMFAMYCFLRGTQEEIDWKWASFGTAAIIVGTLLSWEPVLLGFVLLALALWYGSKTKAFVAAVYAVAGISTMALLLATFMSVSPELRADFWATVIYRMGGTYHAAAIPLHALVDRMYYADQPTAKHLAATALERLPLLGGSIGILALAGLLFWTWDQRKQNSRAFFTVAGLLGVWVSWCILFPNHVYVHAYQLLLAAPLFGIALGLSLTMLTERLSGTLRLVSSVVLPILLLVPLAHSTREIVATRHQSPEVLEYARDVYGNTPSSAVVLSSYPSMVPVYYSHRHFIRYVAAEDTFRLVIPEVWNDFPNSEVYLALAPSEASRFPCATSHFAEVKQTSNLLLLKVAPGVCP